MANYTALAELKANGEIFLWHSTGSTKPDFTSIFQEIDIKQDSIFFHASVSDYLHKTVSDGGIYVGGDSCQWDSQAKMFVDNEVSCPSYREYSLK